MLQNALQLNKAQLKKLFLEPRRNILKLVKKHRKPGFTTKQYIPSCIALKEK